MNRSTLWTLAAGLALTACFGIDEENYPALSPVVITSVSDTVNAQLGIPLEYAGISIESDLPVTLEWAYGEPAQNTTVEQGRFAVRKVLDTQSPTIDYTFNEIGSFILRLKADNGESIAYKFFRLNVNSGYDEGVAILDRDDDGTSGIAFVKTLTSEEVLAGEQELFYFDPVGGLKEGVALYVSDASLSYGVGNQTAFVILTADEQGSIYLLDAKTLELVQKGSMAEFGTKPKKVAGEYARQNDLSLYFLSEDGRVFRYDMLLGYIYEISGFPETFKGCFQAVNRTYASGATTRYPFFFGDNWLSTRQSASAGIKSLVVDSGYRIVNAACARTQSSAPVYVLMQSTSDPAAYRIRSSKLSPTVDIHGGGWESAVNNFTAEDLKMDENSIMLGAKTSSDIYYTYDNAIYRWGMTTAPGSQPAIMLPEGEQIVDIATNFMGKAAAGVSGPDNGEDLLYVATYNPGRAGDRKGSLYVYRFADDSRVAAYEGICHRPVQVIYKYRMN
ncbi:MAG: hypothetical protein IJ721_05370 [Bacteroidales bacterium]|nr:hypothetical protein [Bacteroidales bacterium]